MSDFFKNRHAVIATVDAKPCEKPYPGQVFQLTSRAGSTMFCDYESCVTFCAHLGYEIVPLNSRIGRELLAKARAK